MICHVIDHLALQVSDVAASATAYARLLAPLGVEEVMRFPRGEELVVGLGGTDGAPKFWLGPAGDAATREVHVAFSAADRAAVDAVHAAALDAGLEVLHAPREWPEYHPGYYGVFVRDLDGNNVEAVCHTPVSGQNGS
jgi:catechol 2,3-dioxygenase-like lactoylglutathione lyase family enzyme